MCGTSNKSYTGTQLNQHTVHASHMAGSVNGEHL